MDNDGEGILFLGSLALGVILAVVFWAANNGAIVESLSSTIVGSLFAVLFQFGGVLLLWLILTIICALIPGIQKVCGLAGGLLSILVMVIII